MSDIYAKAGLMLRFGEPGSANYASAPFVMVHAFPDGEVAMTVRSQPGNRRRKSSAASAPCRGGWRWCANHGEVRCIC